jgi:hypothetical protein
VYILSSHRRSNSNTMDSFVALDLSMTGREDLCAVAVADSDTAVTDEDDEDEKHHSHDEDHSTLAHGPRLRSVLPSAGHVADKVDGRNPSRSRMIDFRKYFLKYNLNNLMKSYVSWLYAKPLTARCVTCTITGILGAIISETQKISNNRRQKYRQVKNSIDWLEVLAFGLHGGLVAGPLSYRV